MGAWYLKGACRDVQFDPDWWHADTSDVLERSEAIRICFTCPVRVECLTYAVDAGEREGIWGGKTPTQRDHWSQARRVRSA